MSGPYCETCKHFRRIPLGGAECGDPTKIIRDRNGNRVNSEPEIHPKYECSNHVNEGGES